MAPRNALLDPPTRMRYPRTTVLIRGLPPRRRATPPSERITLENYQSPPNPNQRIPLPWTTSARQLRVNPALHVARLRNRRRLLQEHRRSIIRRDQERGRQLLMAGRTGRVIDLTRLGTGAHGWTTTSASPRSTSDTLAHADRVLLHQIQQDDPHYALYISNLLSRNSLMQARSAIQRWHMGNPISLARCPTCSTITSEDQLGWGQGECLDCFQHSLSASE